MGFDAAGGEHHALLIERPTRAVERDEDDDDDDNVASASAPAAASRREGARGMTMLAVMVLSIATSFVVCASTRWRASTVDATPSMLGRTKHAVLHSRWRGKTMTSSLGYEIDLAPCHAFAEELETLASAFSSQALAKLRDITWIDGFWASPPSEEQHHALEYYLLGIGRTSCAAGVFGMNVVFVRDSAGACEDTLSAYARGVVIRGESTMNEFGRGAVRCIVKPRERLMYTNMTSCGEAQFRRVWINKVPLVNEIANHIESVETFKDLRSKRYFWLDADIGLLQCPDHTAYGFCMSIGAPEYYRERVGFPPFKWLHETLRHESPEDKMMLNCYRNEYKGSIAEKAAAAAHADTDVDDTGDGDGGDDADDDSYDDAPRAALGELRPAEGNCDDIHRISVIANIFGGSKRAINDYTKGYMRFVNSHIPTSENMGSPARPIECSCPSEENVMSSMAIYDSYRTLTSDVSCSRDVHGHISPVDTYKTKLVSHIPTIEHHGWF